MSNVIDSAKKLKEEINSQESVKQFLKYKELVNTDTEILEIKKQLALAIKNKDKELEDKYTSILNSNPIYINFLFYKEETASLLKDIADVINEKTK